MTVITCEQLPELFAAVGGLFTEKRDELCEMDAQMGDGDLGLTMSKGYCALPQLLRDNMEPGDIGKNADEGRHENVLRRPLHHGHADVLRHHGRRQGAQGQAGA